MFWRENSNYDFSENVGDTCTMERYPQPQQVPDRPVWQTSSWMASILQNLDRNQIWISALWRLADANFTDRRDFFSAEIRCGVGAPSTGERSARAGFLPAEFYGAARWANILLYRPGDR